jgi:hypothetical protein
MATGRLLGAAPSHGTRDDAALDEGMLGDLGRWGRGGGEWYRLGGDLCLDGLRDR